MARLFISHASADKGGFVRPLAEALKLSGHQVWYDEYELKVGDSLRLKIDEGLKKTDYGVVVLSKSFFGRQWPERELNALFAIEKQSQKLILPVWHEVTKEDVERYSPLIADIVGARSDKGIAAVVSDLNAAIGASSRMKENLSEGNGRGLLRAVATDLRAQKHEKEFLDSLAGAEAVIQSATAITCAIQEEVLAAGSGDKSPVFKITDHRFDVITVRGPESVHLLTTLRSMEAHSALRADFHAKIAQGRKDFPDPRTSKVLAEFVFHPRVAEGDIIAWEASGSVEALSPHAVATWIIGGLVERVREALVRASEPVRPRKIVRDIIPPGGGAFR